MPAGIDQSRRRFLTGRLARPDAAARPPWSRESTLVASCTGCGACVVACPQQILRLDAGLPRVDFSDAECTFCGACATACPEPVFDRALRPAFPHVVAVTSRCFAARGIVCQSCRDACAEAAIRFPPRLGGPAQPVLTAALCSGCGACIAACPADAIAPQPRALDTGHG